MSRFKSRAIIMRVLTLLCLLTTWYAPSAQSFSSSLASLFFSDIITA